MKDNKFLEDFDGTTVDFNSLQGKVFTHAFLAQKEDYRFRIVLVCSEEEVYIIEHTRRNNEYTVLKDYMGDFADLVGTPILMAVRVRGEVKRDEYVDHCSQWTTIKLYTEKGGVLSWWHAQGSSEDYLDIDLKLVNLRKEKKK